MTSAGATEVSGFFDYRSWRTIKSYSIRVREFRQNKVAEAENKVVQQKLCDHMNTFCCLLTEESH